MFLFERAENFYLVGIERFDFTISLSYQNHYIKLSFSGSLYLKSLSSPQNSYFGKMGKSMVRTTFIS